MSTTREERIEIRSSKEEKKKFEEAAALSNQGLSEFIRFAAQSYAETVLRKHENIRLSKEEGRRFLKALELPPDPNDYLKDAMLNYEKNLKN
jgi:uncharacterized protein (DUF1778 family)